MRLTLSGKEFALRCDMRALAAAKREAGIDIAQLDESDDVVLIGTLVYYMAKSGAKHAGLPFEYDVDDFLGLIDVSDLTDLVTAVLGLLGGGSTEKKREG